MEVSDDVELEIESFSGLTRESHAVMSLRDEVLGQGSGTTFWSLWTTILILPIKLYQWLISPLIPSACRYWPTCSDYMAEAIKTHGVVCGVWLGSKRLCRCHPYGGHGIDLVPINKKG